VLDPVDGLGTDPSLISATRAGFDRQMRHLVERYHPVSADEVLAAARGARSLPHRAVLVTFDDAYRDFGEIAWPILRRHGVPATVFVPTAYPDHPEREFWWDRLYRAASTSRCAALDVAPLGTLPLDSAERRRASIRTLQNHLKRVPHAEALLLMERICADLGEGAPVPGQVLGWSDLRALAREGVALCAHTRTHPALDQLPLAEARAEIRGSREDLLREIGGSPPIFAYPFGGLNAAVADVVREEGFELAVTCLDGHNPLPFREPVRLTRTNITRRTSPLIFALRLLPLFDHVDRWRHRAPTLRARVASSRLAGAS
jgi:peptidoglycan/xylan/chitin deacetylase (PgdA/CDA1 family)